jgi:putative ABC transport system permease protein
MIKSYFLLTLRTIGKNKISFLINLVGMSIALGVSITAYVNYEYNVNFDKGQKDVENIYRINFNHERDGQETKYGVSPMPLGNLVRENVGAVTEVIYYISRTGQFRIGDEMFEKEFIYADPTFSKLFTLDLVYGSLSLDEKKDILISDRLAITYFGVTNVVGKSLTQVVAGTPRDFNIAGVYKAFPGNSSFRFDLITQFENYFTDPSQRDQLANDWKKWSTTFLVIPNKNSLSAVEAYLQQYVKVQNEARPDLAAKNFYLDPFRGMSARAVREKNEGHWFNRPMPPAAVVAPFMMATFLLLVACFNFTNNSIAIAGNRLKEIGIRKVIGGKRKELVIQFLSETLIFCSLAIAISLYLAELFVAKWNSMWTGIEIVIRYENNITFLVAIFALLIIASLLAGSYPALYISRFKPIEVLKGTVKFGGSNWLTKSLLAFQFSISLAAVIFALAFYFNSKFQKEYDLGYRYQNVIQLPVSGEQQFVELRNALQSNTRINSIGGSQHHIYNSSTKVAAKFENSEESEVDLLNVGDDYFQTLDVKITRGRNFIKDSSSDEKESIIVNEEFVRVFGLGDQAVGKRITLADTAQFYVAGVTKDVYLQALFKPLSPLIFRYTPSANYRYLVASTEYTDLLVVNDEIKSVWKKLYPNTLYTGSLMEEKMVMALEHFDNVVILYTFLGAIAILMSVSGLYSMVALNLQKRTKEFGIRKILGAPLQNIVFQASKLFVIIMLIAFVLGSFAGTFMVNKLMDTVWEYYVAIGFKIVFTAITILFTIACVTVSYKIYSVSRTNPAESLKYE